MKGRSTMISNFIYSNGIIEIFVFIAITILKEFERVKNTEKNILNA